MLKLDLINTVAFGGAVLFVGHGLRRLFPPLARYNIPAPVAGGLVVALAVLAARARGVELVTFDTRLQASFQIAFFTTIGFGASVAMLKAGGPQVALLLLVSGALAAVQNAVGIALAAPLGMPPLFGVLNGSVTLAGGPATALAFAPVFEKAGVPGAATVGMAAATVGIVAAGLLGGPIGTILIERHRLRGSVEHLAASPAGAAPAAAGARGTSEALLKTVVAILIAMWLGTGVSAAITSIGVTLPAYIGAMLAAAIIRNLDDATGIVGLSPAMIEHVGAVALSLFLALAMMTLRLWELAGLAIPMVVILAAQIALVAAVCFWPVFAIMGRDYESAVLDAGFCGFMLGITANAMANMEALVERYGPAPRAFLVVPMVGAFFIDFINAILITFCLNIWA